jgi:phosphoglycerol transferase MdoB-like AlkP superfamily enzyme
VDLLTLNSHLPVSADEDSAAILGCGTESAQVSDEAACNLMGLVIRAENAIAKVATRPDLPETEFVIVGDHAPPFIQRARREMFSQREVPYTILKPKKLKSSPKAQ